MGTLKKARILVAHMPQMLREIVEQTVQSQPDMELVGLDDVVDLDEAVTLRRADVAIVGHDNGDAAAAAEPLLLANPELKVVVVTGDGRAATLFELRRRSLVELSPQSLVDAIRAALGGES